MTSAVVHTVRRVASLWSEFTLILIEAACEAFLAWRLVQV